MKTLVPDSPFSGVCNFIKKEALAQVFPCEFCKISKNTFLAEHLRATASNHQKTRWLRMFLGGMKWEHCPKMG